MADGPKLTGLGKLFIMLFVAACIAGAYYLFVQKPKTTGGNKSSSSTSDSVFDSFGSGNQVEIGIAYGTEKERWLKWAVDEWAKTPDGRRIKINLIPMGSLEGAHAVLGGDQRINVWSPASATYKDMFVQDWQSRYSGNPIVKEEQLALTPMVY